MGGSKNFAEEGVFKYKSDRKIAGIKVIEGKGKLHNMPKYSGDSDKYVRTNHEGEPITIRLFKNHEASVDIDWSHPHGKFQRGEIHVHDFIDGKRSKNARLPSSEERRLAEEVIRDGKRL